jgi:UDP-GlcNAc:undecaprenyl-phosphate GlcNAc-1-phosphate transferase
VFLDLCLTAIAYYSAYRLRFDGQFSAYFPQFLQSLPLVLGVQLVSLFVVGGYRGVWQYFGLMDGVTFAKGVGLGTLLNVSLLVYVYRFESYSRGVFVIYAALLMLLLSGSRASFRLISEFAQRRNQRGLRVVIYGAGDVAASAVRDILTRRHGGYRLLGFIVEDPALERAHMQGYPVIGTYNTLLTQIEDGRVDLVVITQLIDVDRLEALRQRCAERQVSLERLHFALDQLVAAS